MDLISLSKVELEKMLKDAAHAGAAEALAAVGLSDGRAAADVRDLRGMLEAYRDIKKTAIKTMVRRIVDMFVMASVLGAVAYAVGFRIGEQ